MFCSPGRDAPGPKRKSVYPAPIIICLVILAGACKSEDKLDPSIENLGRATGPVAPEAPKAPPSALPPVHDRNGTMPPAGESNAPPVIIKGEVLETFDVTRYTYIRLQSDAGEELWAAVLKTPLEVGQPVEIVQSVVMKNFESKTLKRTFPSIIFGMLKDKKAP